MDQKLAHVSILVRDYDEAIHFYTNVLKFDLVEDTKLSETKRWVLVKPKGKGGSNLLLAQPSNEEQAKWIGNQTGGRVFLFLYTDNFERDFKNLKENKIEIVRSPVEEEWGKVLVFKDMYGNLWDLIQPKAKTKV